MAAGLLVSRFVKPLKLPAVTGYLVAGILIGPYCLGALGVEGLGFTSIASVKSNGIICDVALGFIAFAIGNELRLSQIKQIGKQAAVIGVFQAIVATVLVDIVLLLVHLAVPDKLSASSAVTLGAIAAATAPAATLMVVRQYKARGKLTDLLLPIVA
ncbi:MAG: cation:proton antiporter, partial [Clostridia bacterium]|nr:cation:proton antiporter [Clostridia bacterium]